MPIPKLVVTAGLMVAQVALGMTKKTEGPRLDELNVTLAEYGTPLPRFWGIRRFDVPIIWAEKLREKKKTSKTKGGKYSEYKYYGTWAIAIADQQIDSVSRIWFDKHLAYDLTGSGPVSIGALFGDKDAVKLANGTNMRVYLGDQTDPDPRIESWCEDRYGANTAPAYKDVAYIVFQDIPLEKFGNRIPQISVEAISSKNTAYPGEFVESAHPVGLAPRLTTDGSRLYCVAGTGFEVFDIPSRTRIVSTTNDFSAPWPGAITPEGYYTSGSGQVRVIPLDGGPSTLIGGTSGFGGGCTYAGGAVWCYPSTSTLHTGVVGASGVTTIPSNLTPTHYFTNVDGEAVVLGTPSSGPGFVIGDPNASGGVYNDTTALGSTTGDAFGFDNGLGSYLVRQADTLFLVDKTTLLITAHASVAASGGLANSFSNITPGARSFWNGSLEYDSSSLALLRTLDRSDWSISEVGELTPFLFEPVTNALLSFTNVSNPGIIFRYVDRVSSDGVTLQTVVDDVSEWCGLSGQDTSALIQTVQGYSVTQGSGKDMIAPLLDIHDVDPAPHDFSVRFVVRGGVAAGTITTSELARDGDEARYIANITQDTDLPRKITFSFADKGHDQQANNVIAQRPLDSVDAQREQSIDLGTYVSDPATAQQFADRYLRRQWIGRQRFTLGLTAQRLALEPADVYSLQLDDITVKARLTKVTLTNGKLQTEWERDGASVHTVGTGAGASMDGRDPEVIYIPGPTKGFIKDTPLLSDADSNTNPLLYYAAGPYTSTQNWPGAYIMQGDSDGVDFDTEWNSIDSAHAATWGYAATALATAFSGLWDRGHTVNVKGYGTLTSCAEADIDADPSLNLALLGDELLNFTTATLETDGSYTLSGFKRGRRGTEWATSTHAVGDEFVLASVLLNEGVGLSDVGVNLHFKAQTLGRAIDSGGSIDVDFDGRSLMPYAPARVKWTTDGTDLFGEIIRRTRVGGSWVGGATIPLSEASEAYEVDVYHSTTFKRTISVSGTNLFTYTAAMMSADGNAVAAPPPINAYQMSDAVGRGFALAA